MNQQVVKKCGKMESTFGKVAKKNPRFVLMESEKSKISYGFQKTQNIHGKISKMESIEKK